jgi:hypothetical protein
MVKSLRANIEGLPPRTWRREITPESNLPRRGITSRLVEKKSTTATTSTE